jgi:hypothetical protein
MCPLSVMTPTEFSRAEYSTDHSALFRWSIRNLRYRSSGWYAWETTARGVYLISWRVIALFVFLVLAPWWPKPRIKLDRNLVCDLLLPRSTYVQSFGSITLSCLSKMAAWRPYLKSDRASAGQAKNQIGPKFGLSGQGYICTKFQVNIPSGYKTCPANGPRRTLTSVTLTNRSNQKPGYYIMYPY